MFMKKLFLFAAAAALLAACSSKDDLSTGQQPAAPSGDGSVAFDAYTGRAATRAGWAGSLTTTQLKEAATPGFGVFGYYTDNNDYDQRATPNFFYNQLVKYQTTAPTGWVYTPVKYWPNEYGNSAVSDEADKVTYFAYAPWVDVVATSGKIKGADADKSLESYGITGMTKNTGTGDPLLKYIASFNSNKSVDLCWGVADNGDGLWPIVNDGSTMNIKNGTPWLNVLRPAGTDQKVKFTFKHATAQMRINIDAIIDEVRPGATPKTLDQKTRIWVRQITFKGFALKGTLNLNNDDQVNKPNWLDYNGQNELVAEDVIVYDGRKDGKEGVAGAVATNEKVLGLNPAIIQDGVYEGIAVATNPYDKDEALKVYGTKADGTKGGDDYLRPGVTSQQVNLFAQHTAAADINKSETGSSDAIFHVIPVDENFEIEIVYDVETVSENLAQNLSDGATKGTSIENRIRKSISFGNETKLQAGHSYKLDLHLVMNSVKFDAAVSDWIEEAAQDVDLPLNTPILATAADIDPNVTAGFIAYDATKYDFAIAGFAGGESIGAVMPATSGLAFNSPSGTTNTILDWTLTNAERNAWSNGYAVEQLTTTVNPTTSNRTQKVTWTGAQSEKKASITFTQQAHPLKLHVGTDNTISFSSTNVITLERSTAITGTSGWMCAGLSDGCVAITADATDKKGEYITVKRNGVALTWATATTAPQTFTFDNDQSGKITLKDNIQKGDIYEITLKTGDAPAETITLKVVP